MITLSVNQYPGIQKIVETNLGIVNFTVFILHTHILKEVTGKYVLSVWNNYPCKITPTRYSKSTQISYLVSTYEEFFFPNVFTGCKISAAGTSLVLWYEFENYLFFKRLSLIVAFCTNPKLSPQTRRSCSTLTPKKFNMYLNTIVYANDILIAQNSDP